MFVCVCKSVLLSLRVFLNRVRYRCFSMEHTAATKTKSAEGFIDGDLVEHFLDLPQEKMEQIIKGIKVTFS